MVAHRLSVRCCIAGGGPAGLMTGLLLARAGVEVLVLEKHADFLRDFRGDTIHPSTLQLIDELGWRDELLRIPHAKLQQLIGVVGGTELTIADFDHLPVCCPFIAIMPQWDFLAFLAEKGRAYPGFSLRLQAEAQDLILSGDRVIGVRARTAEGMLEIASDLVIAADGRGSLLRDRAGLEVEQLGAPMDVLWFKLSRRPEDAPQSLGRIESGAIFVMIDRREHWQCGYVIPKGAAEALRAGGIEPFRRRVADLAPMLRDRVAEIAGWDEVKLLTVRVDRLRRWHRPGLLCIGDAAHAMSPIGGVGINLAIQDAVATANILAAPLRDGTLTEQHLAAVQRRRDFPTRVTQRLQLLAQRRIIARVLARRGGRPAPPPLLRLLLGWRPVRRLIGRLVGLGVRPEHLRQS